MVGGDGCRMVAFIVTAANGTPEVVCDVSTLDVQRGRKTVKNCKRRRQSVGLDSRGDELGNRRRKCVQCSEQVLTVCTQVCMYLLRKSTYCSIIVTGSTAKSNLTGGGGGGP